MTTEPNEPKDPADAGKHDEGKGGEDRDILGKRQEDLSAEDLEGDAREEGTE